MDYEQELQTFCRKNVPSVKETDILLIEQYEAFLMSGGGGENENMSLMGIARQIHESVLLITQQTASMSEETPSFFDSILTNSSLVHEKSLFERALSLQEQFRETIRMVETTRKLYKELTHEVQPDHFSYVEEPSTEIFEHPDDTQLKTPHTDSQPSSFLGCITLRRRTVSVASVYAPSQTPTSSQQSPSIADRLRRSVAFRRGSASSGDMAWTSSSGSSNDSPRSSKNSDDSMLQVSLSPRAVSPSLSLRTRLKDQFSGFKKLYKDVVATDNAPEGEEMQYETQWYIPIEKDYEKTDDADASSTAKQNTKTEEADADASSDTTIHAPGEEEKEGESGNSSEPVDSTVPREAR